ncbi:hypothetical protein AB835_03230 [Candidatus Endobugula sertula]|uniref:C4-dicarboxylate ABC transporter substrate-binding protein n=1 Tax=Candidatus Endobugula sertula TaxID=62101 RepID=A0A1D2QSB2_9GAMM|nr:hypothetical protein AB835_03230 [Candidatus Endobugula sertula]
MFFRCLKRNIIFFIVPFFIVIGPNLYAEDIGVIGLITGTIGGTYIQIGENISQLAKQNNIQVNVYPSNGSLENIAAVFERDDVQMALVQSDVLGYLRESQNKKLEKIEENIKMMFPLYNEEIHLLARKEITSIYDLNNKHVGVGGRGSGTNLTGDLLFEVTNVWPRKKYYLEGVSALRALENNQIDAFIYVSGYPVELLQNVDASRFHLVPLGEAVLSEYYLSSEIPAGTYSWQEGVVKTVAVKAVLMSSGFKGKYCNVARQLANVIYSNMEWLYVHGHYKWHEVNLYYDLNKWDRYECVAATYDEK